MEHKTLVVQYDYNPGSENTWEAYGVDFDEASARIIKHYLGRAGEVVRITDDLMELVEDQIIDGGTLMALAALGLKLRLSLVSLESTGLLEVLKKLRESKNERADDPGLSG